MLSPAKSSTHSQFKFIHTPQSTSIAAERLSTAGFDLSPVINELGGTPSKRDLIPLSQKKLNELG
jgi:hypothetical protein